jgi:hypothetical protein
MAYLGENCRERVAIVFLVCFSDHASFQISEKPIKIRNSTAYRIDLM